MLIKSTRGNNARQLQKTLLHFEPQTKKPENSLYCRLRKDQKCLRFLLSGKKLCFKLESFYMNAKLSFWKDAKVCKLWYENVLHYSTKLPNETAKNGR